MNSLPRFHLAFPARDLAEARAFYGTVLGCREGRSANDWGDFDFYGHQIVAHLTASACEHQAHNAVDGQEVPVRHFGVILSLPAWHELVNRFRDNKMRFVIEPQIQFAGQRGEQSTFFVNDPSDNTLEFKAFADDAMVFAR